MSYLKELKQHVIKVRGHVHDAYWMVVLLVCTETTKCECLLIPSTSFIIHYPRPLVDVFHQKASFLFCTCFTIGENGKSLCVNIVWCSQPGPLSHYFSFSAIIRGPPQVHLAESAHTVCTNTRTRFPLFNLSFLNSFWGLQPLWHAGIESEIVCI